MRCLPTTLLSLLALTAAAQDVTPDWPFADGHETGPVSAFRVSDIRLRDPHVFVQVPVFGCRDFTDTDIPLFPGSAFNTQINAPLNADSDGDGFLDASTLLVFRPLDQTGRVQRVDLGSGACTAPVAGTQCAPADGAPLTPSTYAVFGQTCLSPLPGTLGVPAYTPPVAPAVAPCLVGPETQASVRGVGVVLPLQRVRQASTLVGNPATRLEPGLLRGFLTEKAANAILLPPDLPLVGGQPFSVLLPGGQGNCSSRNDKDLLDGVPGWWFYFNLRADPVPFTEASRASGRRHPPVEWVSGR